MKHCHHPLPGLPGLILLIAFVMLPSVCEAQAGRNRGAGPRRTGSAAHRRDTAK